MKTKIVALSIIALAAVLVLAPSASAGIASSAHDFSGETWNSAGEICNTCHTPHNSQSVADAPLWNHTITSATYTVYTSATLQGTPGQPGGVSKLCLSCHDGTVALDSYGGETASTSITGTALLGENLSNDHPVSITYGGNEMVAEATAETLTPLWGSKVECASCHDVHNVDGNTYLLRIDNSGSNLCLNCHAK